MFKQISIVSVLFVALLTVACAPKTVSVTGPPPPVVTTQQKISNVVLVAQALLPTAEASTQILVTKNVIDAETGTLALQSEQAFGQWLSGVQQILAMGGSWSVQAIAIQNLAVASVPPVLAQSTNSDVQAVVLILDSIESSVQLIVDLSKQ